MSQTIQERNILFHFDPSVQVMKYDDSRFYINGPKRQGRKGVDFICLCSTTNSNTFYIEVKDFRIITSKPKSANLQDIHLTVVKKYEDTLHGLSSLSVSSQFAPDDDFARNALSATDKILVLHLEPHVQISTYMFPVTVVAQILQQTKNLIAQKNLVAEVKYLNAAITNRLQLHWTVTLLP